MSNVISINHKDHLKDKFQIVIVDCPYNSIQEPEVQSLFSKFVATKLSGYMKEYPYGVLPFGPYDLVGTLLMLCEKQQDGSLNPIMVFKSTSSDRCKMFNLPFEGLDLFRTPETEEHKLAALEIIDSATKRGVNVGYNSSWTIKKHVRENKELVQLIRDLTVTMFVNYYTTYKIGEILIGGAIRFKVDKFQAFAGFKYLQWKEKTLSPIDCPFLFGEKTAIMHLTEFTQEAKDLAAQYKSIWDARFTISSDVETSQNSGQKIA